MGKGTTGRWRFVIGCLWMFNVHRFYMNNYRNCIDFFEMLIGFKYCWILISIGGPELFPQILNCFGKIHNSGSTH